MKGYIAALPSAIFFCSRGPVKVRKVKKPSAVAATKTDFAKHRLWVSMDPFLINFFLLFIYAKNVASSLFLHFIVILCMVRFVLSLKITMKYSEACEFSIKILKGVSALSRL